MRDYREIRVGDVLRHPHGWSWGTVVSFAPNGKPRMRQLDGQYKIFPPDSVVCRFYEYDDHVRQWQFWNDLKAFRRRVGRDRFNHALTLIKRQRRAQPVFT